MFNYYTIIKESSPFYLYNEDDSILFQIEREYKYPRYTFTIKNAQQKDILIFEVGNIFSTKTTILLQNLNEEIILEKKKLIVGGEIISIIEDFKIFGKYKSSILVNNQKVGVIKEQPIFPYKKYLISFNEKENINYYCIILFLITSVHFADGI